MGILSIRLPNRKVWTPDGHSVVVRRWNGSAYTIFRQAELWMYHTDGGQGRTASLARAWLILSLTRLSSAISLRFSLACLMVSQIVWVSPMWVTYTGK